MTTPLACLINLPWSKGLSLPWRFHCWEQQQKSRKKKVVNRDSINEGYDKTEILIARCGKPTGNEQLLILYLLNWTERFWQGSGANFSSVMWAWFSLWNFSKTESLLIIFLCMQHWKFVENNKWPSTLQSLIFLSFISTMLNTFKCHCICFHNYTVFISQNLLFHAYGQYVCSFIYTYASDL